MKSYFDARRRLAAFALALPLACLALGIMIAGAFAADDTTVSVAPVYKLLEPYLVMVVGIVVTTALGWIGMLLRSKLGFDLDANMQKTLQDAAMNAAGSVIARMEGPLGNVAIDVHSPLVKQGVDLLLQKVPDAIAHFGLKPDELARIIQGKIGILQATGAPRRNPS